MQMFIHLLYCLDIKSEKKVQFREFPRLEKYVEFYLKGQEFELNNYFR